MSGEVAILDDLAIPEPELRFTTSRSSGPGGQNVNKVETRVALHFDLEASPSLSPEQKTLLHERLGGRISREGVLTVAAQEHRTQAANRRAALARFADLLAEALRPRAPRKATRVPAGAKARRLQHKRRRSRVKELRKPPVEG